MATKAVRPRLTSTSHASVFRHSARRAGAAMTPTAKMRSPGAAKMRSRAVSARLILQRHRVVTEAMLSSYRGMRVILAGPQSRCFGPKRFCTPALGASSAFRSSSVTRSRRRSVCYWPAIPTRSATQAADCVFTQSTASKPALKLEDLFNRAIGPFGLDLPMLAIFEDHTKYRNSRHHVFAHAAWRKRPRLAHWPQRQA
jgi:hypothetical protein